MNRTTFLIDGFNLYHSLRTAENELRDFSTRWLDLPDLLRSYLYTIGDSAEIGQIFYFSALATHLEKRKPGVTVRHRNYIDCLRANGVIPVLGRFKPKEVYCGHCRKMSRRFEEKETDVAMSVKLMELFHLDAADTIVLVTGDTDLAPAVRTAMSLFARKRIWFLFPYKRKNKELAQISDGHCNIRKERYARHQLPQTIRLSSGRIIGKPDQW